jgi:hypothetical protein
LLPDTKLIAHCAGGFAGGLAGSLTFAAAAIPFVRKPRFIYCFNMFSHRNPLPFLKNIIIDQGNERNRIKKQIPPLFSKKNRIPRLKQRFSLDLNKAPEAFPVLRPLIGRRPWRYKGLINPPPGTWFGSVKSIYVHIFL